MMDGVDERVSYSSPSDKDVGVHQTKKAGFGQGCIHVLKHELNHLKVDNFSDIKFKDIFKKDSHT